MTKCAFYFRISLSLTLKKEHIIKTLQLNHNTIINLTTPTLQSNKLHRGIFTEEENNILTQIEQFYTEQISKILNTNPTPKQLHEQLFNIKKSFTSIYQLRQYIFIIMALKHSYPKYNEQLHNELINTATIIEQNNYYLPSYLQYLK